MVIEYVCLQAMQSVLQVLQHAETHNTDTDVW